MSLRLRAFCSYPFYINKMLSFNLTCSQCPITMNEWISFIRVHRFLKEQQETGNLTTTLPLRNLLLDALGVGEKTAKKVIRYPNDDELPDETKPIGRSKKQLKKKNLTIFFHYYPFIMSSSQNPTTTGIKSDNDSIDEDNDDNPFNNNDIWDGHNESYITPLDDAQNSRNEFLVAENRHIINCNMDLPVFVSCIKNLTGLSLVEATFTGILRSSNDMTLPYLHHITIRPQTVNVPFIDIKKDIDYLLIKAHYIPSINGIDITLIVRASQVYFLVDLATLHGLRYAINNDNSYLLLRTPSSSQSETPIKEYIYCIRNFTLEYNQCSTAVTLKRIQQHLHENGYEVSLSTVKKKDLKLLGSHFGKDQRRNILHEIFPMNRSTYLETRIRIYRATRNRRITGYLLNETDESEA
ncbi:hypothetical protein BDA99DRAFT_539139 [Phascolomyces articulosus]|uniref:Uncharacterized protein n=1 Tax=Phascolomyces articulosus TaxID=60185 RepID=A0AAD5K6J3_9FUNG|nr:hypothetical protein BDA99DRAFT_539139 [Phascolomyces articulosus]